MEYIRTAMREYATGPDVMLVYDGRSGNLLVEGADTDTVTVQIVAHVFEETAEEADKAMARIVDGITHNERQLTIRPPEPASQGAWFFQFNRGMRVDYAVTAPHNTQCQLDARSGRIEVTRVAGPVRVQQKSGRTSIRSVSSDIQVVTRSGAVDLEEIGGSVVVQAASGRIMVRGAGGDVSIQSASGGVRVEQVAGSLSVESASGRVEAVEISGPARLQAASGRVSLAGAASRAELHSVSGAVKFQGPVRGDLDVRSTSGSVHLDVDPAHPFFIDAETQSGALRSDLEARSGDAPPREGAPRVKVRTLSGSIRIGRADPVVIAIALGKERHGIHFGGPPDEEWAERLREKTERFRAHAEARAEHMRDRVEARAERHRMRAERHARGEAGDDADFDELDVEIL